MNRLFIACSSGDAGRTKSLLADLADSKKANLSREKWAWDFSPLFGAIKAGNINVLRLLLENGFSVNSVTTSGTTHCLTPLHWAVIKGRPKIISVLLEFGADPNIIGKNGNKSGRAVDFAQNRCVSGPRYVECFEILSSLSYEEPEEQESENEYEPEQVEPDFNKYSTPLIEVIDQLNTQWKSKKDLMLRQLMSAYEFSQNDPSAVSKWPYQSAPLQSAAFLGYPNIVTTLINCGFDVNSFKKSKSGREATALHWAIFGQQPEVVVELLALGADPNLNGQVYDWSGSAFDFAYKSGQPVILTALKHFSAVTENSPDVEASKTGTVIVSSAQIEVPTPLVNLAPSSSETHVSDSVFPELSRKEHEKTKELQLKIVDLEVEEALIEAEMKKLKKKQDEIKRQIQALKKSKEFRTEEKKTTRRNCCALQ